MVPFTHWKLIAGTTAHATGVELTCINCLPYHCRRLAGFSETANNTIHAHPPFKKCTYPLKQGSSFAICWITGVFTSFTKRETTKPTSSVSSRPDLEIVELEYVPTPSEEGISQGFDHHHRTEFPIKKDHPFRRFEFPAPKMMRELSGKRGLGTPAAQI